MSHSYRLASDCQEILPCLSYSECPSTTKWLEGGNCRCLCARETRTERILLMNMLLDGYWRLKQEDVEGWPIRRVWTGLVSSHLPLENTEHYTAFYHFPSETRSIFQPLPLHWRSRSWNTPFLPICTKCCHIIQNSTAIHKTTKTLPHKALLMLPMELRAPAGRRALKISSMWDRTLNHH